MITELRERLGEEMDRLSEELTVHLPVRLGSDQGEDDRRVALARRRDVRERLQLLGRLVAGLATADPDTVRPDRVGFGSTVRVKDLRSGEEEAYTLMTGDRIDLDAGEISLASPVAQGLLGHRPGDVVDVDTPQRPRRLHVLSLTTIFDKLGTDEAPVARCA